jgi:hypothetical protein
MVKVGVRVERKVELSVEWINGKMIDRSDVTRYTFEIKSTPASYSRSL